MEIIDFGRKGETCIKCHGELSTSEKISGAPICNKCISGLADMIKNMINGGDLKEFSEDVSSFTDFITSSSKLMGLDDIVVVQVCFNIYMSMVVDMRRKSPTIAKNIFKDAKRFIEKELERFEHCEKGIFDKDRDRDRDRDEEGEGEDPFGKMVSKLSDIMRKHDAMVNKKDIKEGDKKDGEDVNNKNEEDGKIGDNGDNIVDGSNDCKNGSKRIRID